MYPVVITIIGSCWLRAPRMPRSQLPARQRVQPYLPLQPADPDGSPGPRLHRNTRVCFSSKGFTSASSPTSTAHKGRKGFPGHLPHVSPAATRRSPAARPVLATTVVLHVPEETSLDGCKDGRLGPLRRRVAPLRSLPPDITRSPDPNVTRIKLDFAWGHLTHKPKFWTC